MSNNPRSASNGRMPSHMTEASTSWAQLAPPDNSGGGRVNYAYVDSEFEPPPRFYRVPGNAAELEPPRTYRVPANAVEFEPPRSSRVPANAVATPLASINQTPRPPSALSYALAINNDPARHYPGLPPGDPDKPPDDHRSFSDKLGDLKDDIAERARRGCTRKLIFKRLPILQWLPKYSLDYAISDLVAGLTVGLTVLPQSIAFASVAGIPAQNGLYSSFFGPFVYTIFGSAPTSAVGPTALQSILTYQNSMNVDFAILLCFYSGLVCLLMGILQLGFVIEFISGPVSIGFTSAAALIIGTTQIKDLLGIKIPPGQFVTLWQGISDNIHNTRLWDAVMGFSCILALYLLREMPKIPIGPKEMSEKSRCQKIVHYTIWLISTARNIVVVIVCAVMAYLFQANGYDPFKLTGFVKPGLPEFKPPPFTTTFNNKTYDFMAMSSELSSGTFVLAILALVEDIATAKAFANGATVDATQEMLAIGVSNILASFVGSMPISGAISRGAVNAASGVKTTFGGIYTGILVLVALAVLTPYFFYIPKASLAAVIIMAVAAMVDYGVIMPIWKTKKIDLFPGFVTFLCCLFIKLELGIIIGVGVNILFLLYNAARPKVDIENATSISGLKYILVTPDRSITYPSVEYVKNAVSKAGLKQGFSSVPVVLECSYIRGIDFTAAKGVKILMDDYTKRKQLIVFFNLKPSISKSFSKVQPKEFKTCTTLEELDAILKESAAKTFGRLSVVDLVQKP